MERILERYFVVAIIGLVSIVEVIVTGGTSDAIALLIPYGVYKMIKFFIEND